MTNTTLILPSGSPDNAAVAHIANRNGWEGLDEKTEASVAAWYDDKFLHLSFRTLNAPLIRQQRGYQAAVSHDSCVEAFIETAEAGRYINFEFNIGCSVNASRRTGRHDAVKLSPEEIATIQLTASPEVDFPTEINGNTNSWTLDADIPWVLLGIKPEKGLRLHCNFQACSDNARPPYYLSWAPIPTPAPDFHRPEFFGDIILG